jgi:hypothetical protein
MAKQRLARYVHVRHPVQGTRHVFGPKDDLPDWAYDAITPSAFAPGGERPAKAKGSDLLQLSKAELVSMAEAKGLPVSGTKQELVDRLEGGA